MGKSIFGNNSIVSAYLGNLTISKIYYGSVKIYPNIVETTVTFSSRVNCSTSPSSTHTFSGTETIYYTPTDVTSTITSNTWVAFNYYQIKDGTGSGANVIYSETSSSSTSASKRHSSTPSVEITADQSTPNLYCYFNYYGGTFANPDPLNNPFYDDSQYVINCSKTATQSTQTVTVPLYNMCDGFPTGYYGLNKTMRVIGYIADSPNATIADTPFDVTVYWNVAMNISITSMATGKAGNIALTVGAYTSHNEDNLALVLTVSAGRREAVTGSVAITGLIIY